MSKDIQQRPRHDDCPPIKDIQGTETPCQRAAIRMSNHVSWKKTSTKLGNTSQYLLYSQCIEPERERALFIIQLKKTEINKTRLGKLQSSHQKGSERLNAIW